jgi:hypothetical protein
MADRNHEPGHEVSGRPLGRGTAAVRSVHGGVRREDRQRRSELRRLLATIESLGDANTIVIVTGQGATEEGGATGPAATKQFGGLGAMTG